MSTLEKRLQKMGISQLNPMQKSMIGLRGQENNIRLLSPTGSGKTLAFLLSIIKKMDPQVSGVQVLILVPARELAIQIQEVFTQLQEDYLSAVCYGGNSSQEEKKVLDRNPSLVIGTPGRILDHLERRNLYLAKTRGLVLDEYDKSLEFGFQREIRKILGYMHHIQYRFLTSATEAVEIPEFLPANDFVTENHLEKLKPKLSLKKSLVIAEEKMEALISILSYYPNKKVILFCNHREAVDRISDYLEKKRIFHGTFHGGMEQQDRERNLLKYRHGSIQILVCTDLAARGLDVPAIDVVVHYQVPRKEADFTHRNGRTARMEKEGEVWVLLSEKEFQPDYVEVISSFSVPKDLNLPPNPVLTTLFISGGKRDKISKFDLVGTFYKAGNLEKEDLGMVQVLKEYSLVTVKSSKAKMLISKLNNTRIKKRKVRVSLAE